MTKPYTPGSYAPEVSPYTEVFPEIRPFDTGYLDMLPTLAISGPKWVGDDPSLEEEYARLHDLPQLKIGEALKFAELRFVELKTSLREIRDKYDQKTVPTCYPLVVNLGSAEFPVQTRAPYALLETVYHIGDKNLASAVSVIPEKRRMLTVREDHRKPMLKDTTYGRLRKIWENSGRDEEARRIMGCRVIAMATAIAVRHKNRRVKENRG